MERLSNMLINVIVVGLIVAVPGSMILILLVCDNENLERCYQNKENILEGNTNIIKELLRKEADE